MHCFKMFISFIIVENLGKVSAFVVRKLRLLKVLRSMVLGLCCRGLRNICSLFYLINKNKLYDMSDQLLTRRNNFLSYVSLQLFINWVFLVFFLLAISRSYFCCSFFFLDIRGSVITFEVSLFEVLDATVCLMYLFVDPDFASWRPQRIRIGVLLR